MVVDVIELFPSLSKSGIAPATELLGFQRTFSACMTGDCGVCGTNDCDCDCGGGTSSDCDCNCHDCDCNCEDW